MGSGRARWRNDGLALRRSPRGEGPIRQEGWRIRDALRTARAYLHTNPHPDAYFLMKHSNRGAKILSPLLRFSTC